MPKRKSFHSVRPPSSSALSSTSIAGNSIDTSDQATGVEKGPTPRLRLVISLLVVGHFASVLIALAANLAPSYLLGRLTTILSPYVQTTGQVYSGLPLELTHAEPFDFPLIVEMQSNDVAGAEWQSIPVPGMDQRAMRARVLRYSRWPNFCRIVQMVATDQPDSEILSDIAARLVALAEKNERQTFRGVRLMAPKVLSYDDDARLIGGQSSEHDDELLPSVVYSATVLRDASERLSLVPHQIPLRTAKPVRGRESQP